LTVKLQKLLGNIMGDICILATGGTIDKVHDPITERLIFAQHSQVPQILHECRIHNIYHEVLMLKDSLDITESDREKIFAAVMARPERSIVVTHGTSTMSMTAEFLKAQVTGKTVVLTGAMRPFSFFQSDAGFNLGGAIVAAKSLANGIYIVMNGNIFNAGNVIKDPSLGIFTKKSE
jgi:L-asparaginase